MENNDEMIIPLLEADDIEVRMQQACKNNKALALLYKTSRTDMRILDKVFGVYGWKDEYKEIKGNLYCGISIYDENKKEWVTKWDCGIESQQEDGNERKAEASDALKRAGFKIGIGRELYSAPLIFLNAETRESANTTGKKQKYELVNPYEKYKVSYIAYNTKREISSLEIINSNGDVVYQFTRSKKAKTGAMAAKSVKANKLSGAREIGAENGDSYSKSEIVANMIKGTALDIITITGWCNKRFGKTSINDLTEEEFKKLKTGVLKTIRSSQNE